MSSKLFISVTAATVVLISSLIALNPSFPISVSLESPGAEELGVDARLRTIPITGAVGPESFAFDLSGRGPFTGLSDGRIVRWDESEQSWSDFAVTSPNREGCEGTHDHDRTEHFCGRPLGIGFSPITGELYIADAYMGLLKVGPEGGLANQITMHDPKPFRFSNGLDISHSDGTIYFTDSSSRYNRRNFISIILNGDKTGRLMKYDPTSKQVTVLLDNLWFPNGLALSKDGDSIIFAETTQCRILRYWLKTSKAGQVEIFKQVPGFPDNIKRSPRGGFWIAMHSRRSKLLGWIVSNPWIGNALTKLLPIDITKAYSKMARFVRGSGFAVRLSEEGEILEILEDRSGKRLRSISEVCEKDGTLWIGSVSMPFVGMYKI